jgi:hypothetical protein
MFRHVTNLTPGSADPKQRVFALPSTNALVVPLSRDNTLVGLLVGEMPEGGGWKRRKASARTRAKRERAAKATGEVEVEVLSAAAGGVSGVGSVSGYPGVGSVGSVGEDEAAEAADTAAQFGDRRQAALNAAARSIVAAWAMHRRADYATAAAVRSDRRVAGFTYAAREPLTVLRTLGGMLSTHLKPNTPSRDMADAIMAQGDVLASLSEELESALYPQQMIEELTTGIIGGGGGGMVGGVGPVGVVDANGNVRGLPAAASSSSQRQRLKQLPAGAGAGAGAGGGVRGMSGVSDDALAGLGLGPETGAGAGAAGASPAASAPAAATTATAKALASGHTPSCDVTPIVAGLLASVGLYKLNPVDEP